MKLYLIVDVLLLLEVFEKFRDTKFVKYKLDPSWLITTLSLTMAVVLLKSKKKIDLITKIDVITEIITVVQGKAMLNNKSLSDYDPTKPITSGLFGDIDSLYPTIIAALLPVRVYYELLLEIHIPELLPFLKIHPQMVIIVLYLVYIIIYQMM